MCREEWDFRRSFFDSLVEVLHHFALDFAWTQSFFTYVLLFSSLCASCIIWGAYLLLWDRDEWIFLSSDLNSCFGQVRIESFVHFWSKDRFMLFVKIQLLYCLAQVRLWPSLRWRLAVAGIRRSVSVRFDIGPWRVQGRITHWVWLAVFEVYDFHWWVDSSIFLPFWRFVEFFIYLVHEGDLWVV